MIKFTNGQIGNSSMKIKFQGNLLHLSSLKMTSSNKHVTLMGEFVFFKKKSTMASIY